MEFRSARYLLLLAIIACTNVPSRAGDGDIGEQSYFAANGLLNRGHHELAVDEYLQFLKRFPDHDKKSLARYGLAVSLYRLSRFEQATRHLTELHKSERFPYAPEVACMLAACHAAAGNHKQAIESYSKVMESHPEHELADDAAAALVEIQWKTGDYEAAIRSCHELGTHWPKSQLRSRAEYFGGRSEMALGRIDDAIDRLESWRKTGQDSPLREHGELLLARAYQAADRNDDAIRAYRRAAKNATDLTAADVLLGLTVAQRSAGQYDAAIQTTGRLLDSHAESPLAVRARFERATALFALERFGDAQDDFEYCADAEGDVQDAAEYWVAKCMMRTGEHEEAARRLERAIKRYPGSKWLPQMQYDRAVAHLKYGQDPKAVEELLAIRKQLPQHAVAEDALYLLASLAHKTGDYATSEKHCQEFLTACRGHRLYASVAFMAAENAFLLDESRKSLKAFQDFIQQFPDDPQVPTARFRIGACLYALARYDESITALEKVAVDGNRFPEAHLLLGEMAFQRGEWKPASAHLQRFLDDSPTGESAGDARLKLGLAHRRLGANESALECFEHILANNTDGQLVGKAGFERGQILADLGRSSEATESFESIARNGDENLAAFALSRLGSAALDQGDSVRAADYFSRAAGETNDKNLKASAMFYEGVARLNAEQYEQSIHSLADFVRAFPSHESVPDAIGRLAMATARIGKCNEAVEHRLRFIEARHEDAGLAGGVDYETAWCLKESGKTNQAAAIFDELLSKTPSLQLRANAAMQLAMLEESAGHLDRAVDLLKKTLSDEKNHSLPRGTLRGMHYRLGLYEFRRGSYDSCAEHLAAALEGDPENEIAATAGFFRGQALLEKGRHTAAATCFETVVVKFAESEYAEPSLLRLGETLAALQRWPASEHAFQEHLRKYVESSHRHRAVFGVGWAQEHQGRLAEARKTYQKVVDQYKGPTAARAQFQIGECLFAEKKFEHAARELLKVDILFAYEEWSAAALYEAGRCFEALGKRVEASRQFKAVVDRFEATEWALMAAKRLNDRPQITIPGRAENNPQ